MATYGPSSSMMVVHLDVFGNGQVATVGHVALCVRYACGKLYP